MTGERLEAEPISDDIVVTLMVCAGDPEGYAFATAYIDSSTTDAESMARSALTNRSDYNRFSRIFTVKVPRSSLRETRS